MEKQTYQLSPSFQELQLEINDDAVFFKVKQRMESFSLLQEFIDEVSEYFGKSKAKTLGEKLFVEQKKNGIVLNKIDMFYAKLRGQHIDPKLISDIQFLIKHGKKSTLKHLLYQMFGSVTGETRYKEIEKQIIEKQSKPVDSSKYVGVKNGLKVYHYKEIITAAEKANCKTLIVFGQTGCGKSTFLNAIVNYLAGVQMDDFFRYGIVIEDESNQLNSITQTITDYYVKSFRTGIVYRLIDTPGFGDTGGINKDEQIMKMIANKFKNDIDEIHSILFVMKASVTRVTTYQQYVFQSVMDLFDKKIAPNFVFIFTFSDSGKPQVLPSVMDSKYGFGNYWNQIKEPKYIEVNNCGFFDKIDSHDTIKRQYWKIGIQCFQKLFKKINCIQAKSLKLSRQMIRKKQCLNIQIVATTQIIQNSISKRQNIKNHIEAIVYHKDQINNNKNFEYPHLEDQWYGQTTNSNITRCNNPSCMDFNCHVGCAYGDGQEKRNCGAMNSSGYCTVCNCHYIAHTNSKIQRKVRQRTVMKINSQNKRKYDQSSKQMQTSEAALKDLFQQLEKQMKKVIEATQKMMLLQSQLVDLQMSTRKPESTRAYLGYLISNQNRTQSPGYQKRVNGYNEAIKQLQLQEDIFSKNGNQNNMNKILNEIRDADAKNIIETVRPGFWSTVKKTIFG